MPLYEYECEKCGHRFEKIQKFSDEPIKECPKCQGEVEKVLSAPAVQFKGAGWYVTDYAKKGGNSSATSDSKSSESSSASTEPKADTKTESKPAENPKPSSDKK